MNRLASNKPLQNSHHGCSDFATMAEKELSAFFGAVKELFGSEQAQISAEDWLHELIEINGLPASTREWQSISTRVSTRLANRVHASSPATIATI